MLGVVSTNTGRFNVPALSGKVKAGTVMLPVFRGSSHTMSFVPSPEHDVNCVPSAETVAFREAEVMSSSIVPVPVMVTLAPVEKLVGDMLVTLPCLEPQSE
jgi:hypothetical protein